MCELQPDGNSTSIDNLSNLQLIKLSKQLAQRHDWMYHCTIASSLKSIIQNREFWLTNLKNVNDSEEAAKIDVLEYENTYYVGCFTFDPKISDDHWKEYGSMEDGVLIAFKKDWFEKEAIFLDSDNQKSGKEFFRIFDSKRSALKFKDEMQRKGCLCNPFYINAFDFFQVLYDDDIEKEIASIGCLELEDSKIFGRILTPEVAGIIKSTYGLCERGDNEKYYKNWSEEKEIRLKVGIQQLDFYTTGEEIHDGMIFQYAYPQKIAVPIFEKAFDEIKIKFSPSFKKSEKFLEELEGLLPKSSIEII